MIRRAPTQYEAWSTGYLPGRALVSTDDSTTLDARATGRSSGERRGWLAEELLAATIDCALRFTFEALAQSRALDVLAYASSALVRVARTELTDIVVRPRIVVASSRDAERARSLLDEAIRRTPVLRALTVPVTVLPTFELGPIGLVPAPGD